MDSFKNIEEIAKGDEVISYDHKTNKTLMGKVTNVFRRTAKKLALVTIGATLFSATPDHPFYANNEYVEASKLNVGDSIYQMDGSYDLVKSVVLKDTTVTVYNFEVNGSHNYFIGDKGYLVHNECRLLDIESIIRKTDDKLIDTFQDFAENVFKNVPGDGTRAALNKKIVDLGDDQKIVDFVKDFAANSDAIKKIGGKVELVDSWRFLSDAGYAAAKADIPTLNLFNKVDEIGEGALKTKLLSKLDDAELVKFSDDFADATNDVLKTINSDEDLVSLWKKYSGEFKGTKYITEQGAFKTCQSVLDNHPDGYLGNLAKQVMDAPKPTNSEQVLVGVTHPSFDGKVFMGRNFKSSESTLEATFKTQTAHPLMRERIKYMDFVRNSVTDETGKVVNEVLANKLLDIDNLSKLTTAGRAGYHGEVRALSDALYELEKTRPVTSSTLSEFDLFIRNSSDKVMQRCPCCFHITHGVKVLEGN